MKKSIILLAAMAGLMTGCLDDDYLGEDNNKTNKVVSFSGKRPAFSRADKTGKDAADELGNKFLVYGIKGDGSFATDNTQEVFDYYMVNYSDGSEYTTTTNTDGWEYVGIEVASSDNEDLCSTDVQTPKFWDYGQDEYAFVALSKGANTGKKINEYITDAKIDYTKIASDATPVYALEGEAEELSKFYISDLSVVEKANYGKPVNLNFRTMGAKIRLGVYETIPGYSVKNITFLQSKTAGAEYDATPVLISSETAENMYGAGTGTLSVYFKGTDTKPDVVYERTDDGDTQSTLAFGALTLCGKEKYETETGNKFVKRTSSDPSYAGDYVTIMPAGTQHDLVLTAKYTLESLDGRGETIEVGPIETYVPAAYADWRPNFAYTYLFKITDLGSGLYPITFDAAEIVDGGANLDAETTLSQIKRPSINAYQPGVTIGIGNNKIYKPGTVYVTVHDYNGAIVSPLKVGTTFTDDATTSDNINLFKITMSNSVKESDVTEAVLANCFNATYPDKTSYTYNFDTKADKIIIMQRVNAAPESFTGKQTIPADESQYNPQDKTVSGAYFTAAENTMYAIQYRDAKDNYVYKIITIGSPEKYYMMNYTAYKNLDVYNEGKTYSDIWQEATKWYAPVTKEKANWGENVELDVNSQQYSVEIGDIIEGCLVFNNPVTKIDQAFSWTIPLRSINLPSSLTEIGRNAFDATFIDNVVIPSGVTSIGYEAFDACHKLQHLTLNEGLVTIGYRAFSCCENLKRLICPSTLQTISSLGFERDIRMAYLHLNDGLKTIGEAAFRQCESLKSVAIPKTVETIDVNAFTACKGVEHIQLPAYCGNYGANVFGSCDTLKRITLDPNGTTMRGKEATWGSSIFSGCKNLTEVNIPYNVVKLGDIVFKGCSSLVTIRLNDNIAEIGTGLFDQCIKLKNVNIPTALSIMESKMFSNCTSLETITIPANITEIKELVFLNCSNLKTVIFEGKNPPTMDLSAFAQSSDVEGNNIEKYYPSGLKIYVPNDAVDTYKIKFDAVLSTFTNLIYPISDLNE